MKKAITLFIIVFIMPLILGVLLFSIPYISFFFLFVLNSVCEDGLYMHIPEIKSVVNRNVIRPDVYNLKGVKGIADSHGDCYIKITFNFKSKDLQSLTNILVNSWKKNKNHRGLTWNKLSKWETLKKTNKNNNKKINLFLSKGSLFFDSKYQWIGIDTNSMKCVYHEFFP